MADQTTSDDARRRIRRPGALIVALAALVSVAASSPSGPAFADGGSRLGVGYLTPEGDDTYSLTVEGHGHDPSDMVVTASAPATNLGNNTRLAFWRRGGRVSTDQQSCATWANNTSELRQPGAALRIQDHGDRVRAITVTQNVIFGVYWGFNIHVMDSEASPVFTKIGGVILDTFVREGSLLPYPWRMCARVVGDVVSFKVWPLIDPEPAWDDPTYGMSVELPDGWRAAEGTEGSVEDAGRRGGRPGWYVGHLPPGQSMQFTDLTTAVVCRPGDAPSDEPSVLVEPTHPAQEPTHIDEAP